jgi:hypothetical protein
MSVGPETRVRQVRQAIEQALTSTPHGWVVQRGYDVERVQASLDVELDGHTFTITVSEER